MTKKEQKHDAQYCIYAFSFIKLQIRIKDIILNWNNNSKIKTKKKEMGNNYSILDSYEL